MFFKILLQKKILWFNKFSILLILSLEWAVNWIKLIYRWPTVRLPSKILVLFCRFSSNVLEFNQVKLRTNEFSREIKFITNNKDHVYKKLAGLFEVEIKLFKLN